MTNVLSRRPSAPPEETAKEPSNLEKYANHPVPSLRQAYKDLKASEGLKASMQKEWKFSQAADRALGCGNYGEASRMLMTGMAPTRLSGGSEEPVSMSKRTIVPINAQPVIRRPVSEPALTTGHLPPNGQIVNTQRNALQNQHVEMETEGSRSNTISATASTDVGKAAPPSSTLQKTLIVPRNAQTISKKLVSEPAPPSAQTQQPSAPNTTPRNAFAHLSPSERAAKRAALIQKLHEIQAELRVLDAETERANAGVRVDEFRKLLETHRRELDAGVRSSSPYFPDYRRPADIGKTGAAGKTSAPAESPSFAGPVPVRPLTSGVSAVPSHGAVSPLFRTMSAQNNDPVQQNSATGASSPASLTAGHASHLFRPNFELSQSQKERVAQQTQQFSDLSAMTASVAPGAAKAGSIGPSPGGYEDMLRLKHGLSTDSPATGLVGVTPQASSITQQNANGLAQQVPASTSSQLSVPPLFQNMPAQFQSTVPKTHGAKSTVAQPPSATATPPARTFGTAAQQIIARRDKEFARQDAANARAATAALKRSQALERKTLAAEKKAAKASTRVPANTGPACPATPVERELAQLAQILLDGNSGRPSAGLLAGIPRASTSSTTPRNGATASQPSAAPGSSSCMVGQRSGSGILRSGSGNLFSDVKAAQSQSSPLSNGALPLNKKTAIVEPPRTGAVSPYGHRFADAPETSRLLAELENLTRGAGTPVVESKPSVDSNSSVETKPGAEAHVGYPYAPVGMSGLPGTAPSSYPAGVPSSSSAYLRLQTSISATQPLASRPTSSLATPLASSQAKPMDKGKGKAISPVKAKPYYSTAKPKTPEEKRPARKRNTCPVAVRDRADRVQEQRMYMVHRAHDDANLKETCNILGSTGNVYTVEFGRVPTCTCPDFYKGNHCKHIIFVALKVLRMPEYGDLWYQKAYLDSELRSDLCSGPAQLVRLRRGACKRAKSVP